MLEDYYVKPSTIDRVRSSWLAPQIESYLEWLEIHGYSRLVVYRRLPLLFHFAEFAQKGCRDVASFQVYTKEFASQWLEQDEPLQEQPRYCASMRSTSWPRKMAHSL